MSDGESVPATWGVGPTATLSSVGRAIVRAESHDRDGHVRLCVRPADRSESSFPDEVDLECDAARTLADAVDPDGERLTATVQATAVDSGELLAVIAIQRHHEKTVLQVDSDEGGAMIGEAGCDSLATTLRAAAEVIDDE